jgi:hypothetical protein
MPNRPILKKEPALRKPTGLVCWIDPQRISPDKPTGSATPRCGRQFGNELASLARLIVRTTRTLFFSRLQVRLLQGVEKSSRQTIRMAYVGDDTSYHYLVNLFFSEPPETRVSRGLSWPHLSAELRTLSQAVDLSVLDLEFPLPLLIRHWKCLNVPRWVKQRVPIGDTWEEVSGRIGRKTRREAQRIIKKFDFRSRVVEGCRAAEHFYDRLYLPYIRQRHGHAAEIVGRERFIRECQRSQVIQLLQGDNVVAAVAVRLSNRQMTLAWTGIDTELPPAQRLGAADALDFFSLIYAYQCGCSHMDMGHSRACLDDGVLRYKRKWGASVYRKKLPQGSILIAPLTSSPAVFSLLANARFITLDGGRLVCRTILPMSLREEEVEGFLKHTWIDGLQRVRFLTRAAMSDEATRRFSWAEFVTLGPADRLLEQFMASVPVPRN